MSPFIKAPDGFSSEALDLLDGAMNDMWTRALALQIAAAREAAGGLAIATDTVAHALAAPKAKRQRGTPRRSPL